LCGVCLVVGWVFFVDVCVVASLCGFL